VATTYIELLRQAMLNLQPRSDGVTRLAVEQAINNAQRIIAAIKDFDELMILDRANAFTEVLTSGDISVVFANSTNQTITRTTGSFVTNGFTVGTSIFTNNANNGGPLTVLSVAALIITVHETLANSTDANCTITHNKSLYHIEDDLSLTRPKDVYSMRLVDGTNSRKLDYVPSQRFDSEYPYPAILGTQRPVKYTTRGRYVELLPMPDDVYPLYVQYSQWPAAANYANANDTTPFTNIDYVIVSLATEMALASLEGGGGNWHERARQLLGIATMEETTRPDQRHVARPFNPAGESRATGEYWLSPWVKSS
jgi:hypothetical protein